MYIFIDLAKWNRIVFKTKGIEINYSPKKKRHRNQLLFFFLMKIEINCFKLTKDDMLLHNMQYHVPYKFQTNLFLQNCCRPYRQLQRNISIKLQSNTHVKKIYKVIASVGKMSVTVFDYNHDSCLFSKKFMTHA